MKIITTILIILLSTTLFSQDVRIDTVQVPIELLYFKASLINDYTNLDWETSAEINNDYFIVEKSKDANNWEFISLIDGAGNSNTILSYNLKDFNPYNGTNYYRLKQVDFDGKFKYFDIKSIYLQKSYEISFYPNPCYGSLNIKCDVENNENLEIYNTNGQLVSKSILSKEDQIHTVNLSFLEKGSYIIKIDDKLTETIILK
jgi:hypothetical protein